MRHIVIAENEDVSRALILVDIHVALYTMLDVNKLAEMQEGAIEKVDVPAYKANVRAALIVGDTGGVDDVGGRNT
jgi:hypothetical protein